jgi:hypothetical protein
VHSFQPARKFALKIIMKKWSYIVAGLYGLALLALSGPLVLAAFAPRFKLSELLEVYQAWQFWVIVAIMVVSQFALLRIPVCVASRRPVTRRPLFATVIAAAFMMGLLALGAAAAIYEFATKLEGDWPFWLVLGIGVGGWLFWAICFYRISKRAPDGKSADLKPWLLKGSILELLIAVPTHIVARHRDYCCAGLMTFIGLACGSAVMLFAFGPAVYFLFVERWRRLHPNDAAA